MARRLWIATIGASLCAGLLPACALLPGGRTGGGPNAPSKVQDPYPAIPAAPVQTVQPAPPPSSYHAVSTNVPPPSPILATAQQHTGEEEQHAPEPRDTAPADAPPQHLIAADPPPKEPLLVALERFLEDRPDEALTYLQRYDEGSQELFLRLLPLLAQLTRKNPGQLEPAEVAALSDQLQGLMVSLRYRADLGIDTICFCSRVKGYGDYTVLPANHVYRPETEAHPGELVQLYVELRNFCMEPCADGYEARLCSLAEIHDEQGKCVFQSAFEGERRLNSRTPRRDHCNSYTFYVPPIPSGRYILTLQVRDVTRSDAPREAKKSVEFRVGS